MEICRCGHGSTRHYWDLSGKYWRCAGRNNMDDDSCECRAINMNEQYIDLHEIVLNSEIEGEICVCLHRGWDHIDKVGYLQQADIKKDKDINLNERDFYHYCKAAGCDCQAYKELQLRCVKCKGSSDKWRGNREKNQWICVDCWKKVPESRKKIIKANKKAAYHANKLQVALDIPQAVDKFIALFIGRELTWQESLKNDKEVIDSNTAEILALVRAMGNTRQLVAFDEHLNRLGHLVRVTQKIIDDFVADDERLEGMKGT